MMSNLFMVFEPSTYFKMGWNWFSIFFILFFLVFLKWSVYSRSFAMMFIIFFLIWGELKILLLMKGKSLSLVLVTLFLILILMNMSGLMPYIFTPTSHLVITLSLALTFWMGYFTRVLKCFFGLLLAHLVPLGTPSVLIPFMVLIESVSMMIRPGTLALRLAANMVAGHLLLTLMSSAVSIYFFNISILVVVSQILLMLLEMAVALIQAYVFTILMTLYVSEI